MSIVLSSDEADVSWQELRMEGGSWDVVVIARIKFARIPCASL